MAVIEIPEFAMVLLIGPSGCGKTTFAHRHFAATEVLSSDNFRALVCDDESDLDATADAIAVLKEVLARRLARRRLTVVDATNLRPEERGQMLEIAQRGYAPAVALLFDVPEKVCHERNRTRPNPRPPGAIRRQHELLRKSFGSVRREGFSHVHKIGPADMDAAQLARQPLWTDKRAESGPFDVVGDVHGCLTELLALLAKLGYAVRAWRDEAGERRFDVAHPEGRRLIFVGDLGDRGPDTPGVFALVMDAVAAGVALCVKGNHDLKLYRHLRGREVSAKHGFDRTLEQLASASEPFKRRLKDFLDGLRSHYLLDGGALAVAHAGVKEAMQARGSRLVTDFCLFGETTGEIDEFGLPVRHDWAANYRGKAAVVYGHTPVVEAAWVSNTLCLDTGCVFGGKLTALRWPERALIDVQAEQVWYEPIRPLAPPAPPADRLPDAPTLLGKSVVETRFLDRPVAVQLEQATAAFEALSRHTADPRWLVFVAPTTATVESSALAEYLEHPMEAFNHYANAGVTEVVVQKKHMGSRGVAIVCRDEAVAARRFRDGTRTGLVLSKSGRPFFDDPAAEARVLDGLRADMDATGLWDRLNTDWIVFDGEVLPWNLKAGSLIRDTFAGTGCAGLASARAVQDVFAIAAARGVEGAAAVAERAAERGRAFEAFRAAYGSYVQPYAGPQDIRFAPFHVLAAEGRVFAEDSHGWHMGIAEALAGGGSGVVEATPWLAIDPASPTDRVKAVAWWEELTAAGHEGFIVKAPRLMPEGKGLAPSIKVRGKEYLRIIYGAEYDRPEVLKGLKNRATSRKRQMARIGLALGLESLARFVEGASFARVHEAVAAAIAVGSEPIDIRL